MVLMASFFLCIKMTLLFFYKRLFLVTIVSCLFTQSAMYNLVRSQLFRENHGV